MEKERERKGEGQNVERGGGEERGRAWGSKLVRK